MTELKRTIKERRNKLEIYFDVLSSVEFQCSNQDFVRPTRIQQQCNLSYDKFQRYLTDLENKKMIIINPIFSITSKGKNFVREYTIIKSFIAKIGIDDS